MAKVQVQAAEINYAKEKPIPELDPVYSDALPSLPAPAVPVLRVFGRAAASSATVCLRVHNVFPSLLIPLDSSIANLEQPPARTVTQIAHSLDAALRGEPAVGNHASHSSSHSAPIACVHAAWLVRATPMYAYHSGERLFVKIELYDPSDVSRAQALLVNGSVLGVKTQPYDAHIGFKLQCMMTLGIGGMDFVHADNAKFRSPLSSIPSSSPVARMVSAATASAYTRASADDIQHAGADEMPYKAIDEDTAVLQDACRTSPCDIEADVDACNVSGTANGDGESVPSLQELWNEETRRRDSLGKAPPNPATYPAVLTSSAETDETSIAAAERLRYMVESDQACSSYGQMSHAYAKMLALAVPAEGNKAQYYHAAIRAGATDDGFCQGLQPQDRLGVDESTSFHDRHPGRRSESGSADCMHNVSQLELPEKRNPDAHDTAEEEKLEEEGLTDLLRWMRSEYTPDSNNDGMHQKQVNQVDGNNWALKHHSDEGIHHSSMNLGSEDSDERLERQPKRKAHTSPNADVESEQPAGKKACDSWVSQNDVCWNAGEDTLHQLMQEQDRENHLQVRQGCEDHERTGGNDMNVKSTVRLGSVSNAVPSHLIVLRPRKRPIPEPHNILDDLIKMGIYVNNAGGATYSNEDDWKRTMKKPHRPLPACTAPAHLPHFRSKRGVEDGDSDGSSFPSGIEGLKISSNLPSRGGRAPQNRASDSMHLDSLRALPVVIAPCTYPPESVDVVHWLRESTCNTDRKCSAKHRTSASVPQRPASPKYDEVAGLADSTSNVSQVTQASELRASTLYSQGGFRLESGSAGVTWAALEIDAECDKDLKTSDPKRCAVRAVCIAASDDHGGALVVLAVTGSNIQVSCTTADALVPYDSEEALLRGTVHVLLHLDPDIIIGHDTSIGSLGYLRDRSLAEYGWNLLTYLGRAQGSAGGDWEGTQVVGRVCLNMWRIIKDETNLAADTLEAAAEGVLGERVPAISRAEVERWWMSDKSHEFCIAHALARLSNRTTLLGRITSCLDTVGRAAEMARVLAIDFKGVIMRGSQYRVEGMSLRLAKLRNFVAPSPTEAQVQAQPAMQAMPLTMEPRSRFFSAPVAVLDFQSLYPSLIVAYNLCFSTCLGVPPAASTSSSMQEKRRQRAMGILSEYEQSLAEIHPEKAFIAPNGAAFVNADEREGILPRMLKEVLQTRSLAKSGLAEAQTEGDHKLARTWDARQLALKLLANVTYGYTAAGYSGRMPMAELADSIVLLARTKLENAAQAVNDRAEWNAEVVYGDTDSLFIHMPGRTREQAFQLAQEIANEITSRNPKPIRLKVEKVYQPCILCVKKRYVGLSFVSSADEDGEIDSKGLENIRRDACPVVKKILDHGLSALFRSGGDLSWAKLKVQKVYQKVLDGRAPLIDFVFRREVRLGEYSASAHSLPAAAIVAARLGKDDPKGMPQHGERVPFLVLAGHPTENVSSLVAHPSTLTSASLVSAKYYLHSQMAPALDRVIGRAGGDAFQWLMELKSSTSSATAVTSAAGVPRIDTFYASTRCPACGAQCLAPSLKRELCVHCKAMPQAAANLLFQRARASVEAHRKLHSLCMTCGGMSTCGYGIVCESLDCPMYYMRADSAERARHANEQLELIE